MIPTNVLLDRIMALIAADSTTLAPAALAVHVHLAKAAFVPGPALTPASFTEADFNGATAKSAGLGTQQSFNNPATGGRIVQLLEPAGGWHWQAGSGLNLPQTIYGFYVTDNADAVLYGSQLLPSPVQLLASGDGLDIAEVRIELPPGAIH